MAAEVHDEGPAGDPVGVSLVERHHDVLDARSKLVDRESRVHRVT